MTFRSASTEHAATPAMLAIPTDPDTDMAGSEQTPRGTENVMSTAIATPAATIPADSRDRAQARNAALLARDMDRPHDTHGELLVAQWEQSLQGHLSQVIPDGGDLAAARKMLRSLLTFTELMVASDVSATAARAVGLTDDEFGELFEAELERRDEMAAFSAVRTEGPIPPHRRRADMALRQPGTTPNR